VTTMYIKKAIINGFGKYDSEEFDFGSGVNIVYGDNEAGKSTLLWFIRGMLYGLKGGKAGAMGNQPAMKKYRPWEGSRYSGSLQVVSDDGKTYYITRDFEKKSLNIFDEQYSDITGKILTSKDMQPGEVLLGFDEACFESTCFIGPTGAGLSIQDKKDMENKLLDISQTGFFDVSLNNAVKILEDYRKEEIGNITDRRAVQDRPLNKTIKRITELEEEKHRYEKIRNNIEELQFEYESIKKDAKECQERLNIYSIKEEILSEVEKITRDILKKNELEDVAKNYTDIKIKLEKLIQEETQYKNDINKLSFFSEANEKSVKNVALLYEKTKLYKDDYDKAIINLNRYKNEEENIKKRLEQYKAFTINNDDIDSLPELVRTISIYEAENKDRIKREKQDKINKIKRETTVYKRALLSTLLCGTPTVFAVFYFGSSITGIILAFLLLSGLILFFIKGKKLKSKLSETDIESYIDDSEELRNLRVRYTDILNKFQCESFDIFKKKLDMYRKLITEIDNLKIGQDMQQGIISEKKELLDTSYDEFQSEIEIYPYRFELNKDDLLKRIDNDWHEFKDKTFKLNLCANRIKDLTGDEKSLVTQMKNLGFNSLIDLKKGIQIINDHIKEKISDIEKQKENFPDINEFLMKLKKYDIKNLQNERVDSLQRNKKDREMENKRYNELLVTITNVESEISRLWKEYSRYNSINEELELLAIRRDNLFKQDRLIQETVKALIEAGDCVKGDIYLPLTEKLVHSVNLITAGKYKDIKISEKLDMNTVIDNNSSIKNIIDFSTGTVEQIFLAMRMSALELIEGSVKCPVFADEIFAAYDDKRALNTLKLLEEAGKARQIILFTCRKREPELAKEIVSQLNIINI